MKLLRTIIPVLLTILLAMMVCICPLQAENNLIPTHIQRELSDAYLSGQGDFRWYGFKIYDATLWVEKNNFKPSEPISSKFILDLCYARDLYGGRIAKSSIEQIRHLGFGTSDQQNVWLEKMKAIFPDVRKGTHISGVYLPDKAARFYLDGKLLGEVDDPEFARAFFSIWLDMRTSASSLRSQLLNTSQ